MKAMKNIVKLAATGATIFAIGFAVVTLEPEGEVQSSDADIGDFSFGDKPRERMYLEALDDFGLSKPETFDLNGNVIHFASGYTRGEPRRIMEDYQRKFHEMGFNTKQYSAPTIENQREIWEGQLIGDMVPVDVTDDRVIMMSAKIRGGPRSMEELASRRAELRPETPEDYQRLFTGHRWLEIVRDDEYKDRSMVVSSWSDEFDLRKMDPKSKVADLNVDTEVPACPGCERLLSFDKLDGGKIHGQKVFRGTHSPRAATRYYVDAMRRRGWELSESSAMLMGVKEHVEFEGDDAELLQFARGREFMTVLAYPAPDGKTTVQVLQSD